MATQEQTLRLMKLEVSNFMRIEALSIDAEGKHIVISGANGVGKTSVCEALWTLCRGWTSKECPEPVHMGADKARIKGDFGEYLVERTFTDKGTRLTVTAADGSKVSKPQELLNGFLATLSLDPVAFLSMRPVDQVDMVLAVAGIEPPVGEVMTITGEAHKPLPGESASTYLDRLSADETGLFYVRRREANRVCDQKRAALEEERQHLEKAGGPLSGEAEVSTSDVLKQIEQLQQKADQRRAVLDQAKEAVEDHEKAATRLGGLKEERDRELQTIADLERSLALKREAVAKLEGRIAAGEKIVQELEAERAAAEEAAAQLPDPAPQINGLRQKVGEIERTQAQRMKRQLHQQRLETLAKDLEAALSAHKTLDGTLEALRTLRGEVLDRVDLGIPGLKVGMGELRLNDVPFRQASQAEQIRAACALAMRQKPKLKLLRLDEGERLDSRSKEMVLRMAAEHGFQVIMACVSDASELKVEIVEAS